MAVVIMWVSSHNIVCVMLFIAKAHSHSYLVDSKTTGQVREGRWYSTRRKREHRKKERITLAAIITYQLCPNLLCILACVNFLGAHSSRYFYLIFREKNVRLRKEGNMFTFLQICSEGAGTQVWTLFSFKIKNLYHWFIKEFLKLLVSSTIL